MNEKRPGLFLVVKDCESGWCGLKLCENVARYSQMAEFSLQFTLALHRVHQNIVVLLCVGERRLRGVCGDVELLYRAVFSRSCKKKEKKILLWRYIWNTEVAVRGIYSRIP